MKGTRDIMNDNSHTETNFSDFLKQQGIDSQRNNVNILQLNIGRKCNQSCIHCHVNASPARTEEMSIETIDRILTLLSHSMNIKTVDITGGAPELNPAFRYLITKLKELEVNIIDRCNLTILLEKGQETTADFLAENKVTIIASLPCYTEENVDKQRGKSVYSKSIEALKLLNKYGYGVPDSGRVINLAYNPLGNFLPGNQAELEASYKENLWQKHGIIFNHLYTLTNMPINRYADLLIKEGAWDDYNLLLYSNFNPQAAQKIMCRQQLSINWDGKIYDCDFNQALDIPVCSSNNDIWKINDFDEVGSDITYAEHCFGCTAGSGSSCQGELVK